MSIIGNMLRGGVQLPAEQWGDELAPKTDRFPTSPEHETWDTVEYVASQLGVSFGVRGDRVYLYRDGNCRGDFTNTTQGVRIALAFLEDIAC